MIGSGIELMLIGMSVVFAFLLLLVAMINLTTRLLDRFAPAPSPQTRTSAPSPSAPGPSPDIIAAITTAIKMHRSKR